MAKVGFELLDLLADRRLRAMNPFRCARKPTGLHDSGEGAQKIEIKSEVIWFSNGEYVNIQFPNNGALCQSCCQLNRRAT
ncbi:hypothetical protein [Sinorhizobium meliloti]|uniref:hypothetical protein n=1 Tax=Rhizobium meliloti TaxID=382 RepID=UPI001F3F462F|nr:hypothetical protein [Sinorhizobium meliloti]